MLFCITILFWFAVDDGTGALDCFLDIHNNECEILNNKINNSLKLVNDSEQENYSHMLDVRRFRFLIIV